MTGGDDGEKEETTASAVTIGSCVAADADENKEKRQEETAKENFVKKEIDEEEKKEMSSSSSSGSSDEVAEEANNNRESSPLLEEEAPATSSKEPRVVGGYCDGHNTETEDNDAASPITAAAKEGGKVKDDSLLTEASFVSCKEQEEEDDDNDGNVEEQQHGGGEVSCKDKDGNNNNNNEDRSQHRDNEDGRPVSSSTKNAAASSNIPYIPLAQGLSRKATPYDVSNWVALALTLDGRDKLTKLLQYLSRILCWYYGSVNALNNPLAPRLAERFASLKATLTQSRKAYRMGRSLIELHRLRKMNLFDVVVRDSIVRRSLNYFNGRPENDDDDGGDVALSSEKRKALFVRRASSNIGWGPATADEYGSGGSGAGSRRGFYRSISNVAGRMYRPMVSRLVSFASDTSQSGGVKPPEVSMVHVLGSALKLVGLCGFWAGDNVSYLTQTGLFDDFGGGDDDDNSDRDRLRKRKELAGRASRAANRFYFMGALAGLVVNLRSYVAYRRTTLAELKERVEQAQAEKDEDDDDVFADDSDSKARLKRAIELFDKAKERQFVHFTALLKSCCDVLVFSNNPGINLWRKHAGYPMHEGFHCLCGLTSASTVLYNNFPNNINSTK